MPYVPKNKKRSTRRKRVPKKRRAVFRMQKQVRVAFPKTTVVRHRYVTAFSINPVLANAGYHWFRANSMFGPDFTASGHQPLGFDQWSTFYNHYIVLGSKIKATFSLAATGTEVGSIMVAGILLSDAASGPSDVTTLVEQGNANKKYSYFNLTDRPKTVSKGYSAKKFFNIANVSDNVTRIGAPVTAHPPESAYYGVFVGNANTSIDCPNILVMVQIDFITLYSEPKILPQS